MGELTQAIKMMGERFTTAILQYPTGRYGIVGSVPYELTKEIKNPFGSKRSSMSWDTEQEVIDALINVGITKFQLNDCSWYENK